VTFATFARNQNNEILSEFWHCVNLLVNKPSVGSILSPTSSNILQNSSRPKEITKSNQLSTLENLSPLEKLEEICQSLKIRSPDWKSRLELMDEIPKIISELSENEFQRISQDLSECLSTQMKDRRSAVVPKACKVLLHLAKTFSSLDILAFQSALFQCIRTSVKIIQKAGIATSNSLVQIYGLRFFPIILEGMKEKHHEIRKCVMSNLKLLLLQPESLPWESVYHIISMGIKDSHKDVRKTAIQISMTSLPPVQQHQLHSILTPEQMRLIERNSGAKRTREPLHQRRRFKGFRKRT